MGIPGTKQRLVDAIVAGNFPNRTKHREVAEHIRKTTGLNYGAGYVGIVRKEIATGKVKSSSPKPPKVEEEMNPVPSAAVAVLDPPATVIEKDSDLTDIFRQIKIVKEAAAQCGGMERLKEMAEEMMKHGL